MKYLSLFSGIEAASAAWGPLGWEPVAFCEIDAFPSAVLAHRFPEVPNLGDITKVDWSPYASGKRKPDVIVGGSPCQSFSVAGNREGLAGESGLMFEYIRAVRGVMPRCFVWENVPGAFTSDGGEAFRQLLSEMDALGYGMAWRVLDAQFFGVAQRRERVFLVGCLGDPRRAAEILFEPDCLRWDTPSSREKRQELAERAGRRASGGGGGVTSAFSAGNTSKAGGIGYAEEQSPTLRAGESGTNMVPTALVPVYAVQGDIARGAHMGQNGCGYSDGGECFTLNTMDVHAVAAPVCLGDDNAKASCDVDMCGALKVGGSSPVVSTVPRAFMDHHGTAACYTNFNDGTIANALCADFGVKQQNHVQTAYDVRRLMPVECERLQGFPDGWTDLTGVDPDTLFERMRRDYMGEAEGRKLLRNLRKWCADCPDTPRYKALGNSMAVPVMRWIGERIAATEGAAC